MPYISWPAVAQAATSVPASVPGFAPSRARSGTSIARLGHRGALRGRERGRDVIGAHEPAQRRLHDRAGEPLPGVLRRRELRLLEVDDRGGALVGGHAADLSASATLARELGAERERRVQAGQHVEHVAVLVEDVVRAVAGRGAHDPAAVAEVDRHRRDRALARPVQDEVRRAGTR